MIQLEKVQRRYCWRTGIGTKTGCLRPPLRSSSSESAPIQRARLIKKTVPRRRAPAWPAAGAPDSNGVLELVIGFWTHC